MTGHEIPPLALADFPDFFRALWASDGADVTPFPWQLDLVAQVARDRRWPDLVDLPTGSGKTSILDIAVFLQALGAELAPAERWMPRRVALVVDRRVIVDQADARGGAIRRRIEGASDGVLRRVADRLRHLSGSGPPLLTAVLRGGIVRDETWAQRPDVPSLISSTVDQVGSRLLFRGYGLSPGMQPIHAGLLSNDTLFLLDEVHLAQPFAETLDQVREYRRPPGDRPGDASGPFGRWHVVQLTATPTGRTSSRFPARPLDPGAHPVLRRRLLASKPARLELVKVPKDADKASDAFAAACVRHAAVLTEPDHVRTVGVIVNRVDAARRVARLLATTGSVGVCLITGRMRAADRDRVLRDHQARLVTGRDRSAFPEPLVVVATQSIEAGADFDLDGIVTECASLDALRQRFGRVDRDGALAAAGTPAPSVIVARSTDVGGGAADPVYGTALANTWSWLCGLGVVDFGITALALPEGEALAELVPPPGMAPLLLPSHLDQWVQRSQPRARAEPEVSRWLHGLDADEQVADVELVWRSDLDSGLLDSLADREDGEELRHGVIGRIAACPPTSSETLGVAIGVFRRWAVDRRSGRATPDLVSADAPTSATPEPLPRWAQAGRDRYLRWNGTTGELVSLDEIRPGDTLVLPASSGGIWLGNWDPTATDPVTDLAAETATTQRRLAVARLTRATGATPLVDGADIPDPDVVSQVSASERAEAIRATLRSLADHPLAGVPVPSAVAEHLAATRSLIIRSFPEAIRDGKVVHSYVAWSKEPMPPPTRGAGETAGPGALAVDDGDDATSFTGTDEDVTLGRHLAGVAWWAAQMAEHLGWPPELVADVGLAGRLHDAGKVDSRFQRWLHDGDEMAATRATEPLAKSVVPDTDRVRRRQSRRESGYPDRARHEMLSLAMVAGSPGAVSRANDPDLVHHLVASHHGYARYRFDPLGPGRADDPAPPVVELPVDGVVLRATADYGLARLDRGVPDRFWTLVRRYGWFTLAWIEAVLRLADHERSRRERAGAVGPAPGDRARRLGQEVGT